MHAPDHSHTTNRQRVFWAMLLTGGFMLAEVAGGLLSGSLALLADAGHMLMDAAALFLAWLGFRISERGHDMRRSFGYHRFQVLAAFVNGLSLIFVAGWICVEAIDRIGTPTPILAGPMLAVAALGLAVNIVVYMILHGADMENLNVRGAALHVLGDMLGSAAAIGAAIVILLTGWTPIDPILSVFVVLLILKAAIDVIRRSGHILLEGAPEGLDLEAVKDAVAAASPDIYDVHHVHAWSLTAERPMLTLHAKLRRGADLDETLARARLAVLDRFGIEHTTIQLETGSCPEPDAARSATARP